MRGTMVKYGKTLLRVCLWCYSECISTLGKLKNQPDHGGSVGRALD